MPFSSRSIISICFVLPGNAGKISVYVWYSPLLLKSCLDGAKGIPSVFIKRYFTEEPTDRINALNSAPKDVSGAGDSLLITSAMTLASGGNIWQAALLGSLAAAIQVGRVGNTPLKTKELLKELLS